MPAAPLRRSVLAATFGWAICWALACQRAAPPEPPPTAAAALETLDLLADRTSWQGSGWHFQPADAGPPLLRVSACCTGGGPFDRPLPTALGLGPHAVRIAYANTECRHLVAVEIALHEETGDAAPWARWHSLANAQLDGVSGTSEVPFTLAAQPPPGTRLMLRLFASGGLHCCGETRVASVVLAR
jgi:hypothetical protein